MKKNFIYVFFLVFIYCKNNNDSPNANKREAGIDSIRSNPSIEKELEKENNTIGGQVCPEKMDTVSKSIAKKIDHIERKANDASHVSEMKEIKDSIDNIHIADSHPKVVEMLNKHLDNKKRKILHKQTDLEKAEIKKGDSLEGKWKTILEGAMTGGVKQIDAFNLSSYKTEVNIFTTQNRKHHEYDDLQLRDVVGKIKNIEQEIPKVEELNKHFVRLSQISFNLNHVNSSIDKKIENFKKEIDEIKSKITPDMNSEYGDPYRTAILHYADNLLNTIEEKHTKMAGEEEKKLYKEWEGLMKKIEKFETLNDSNTKNYISQLETIKKSLEHYSNLSNKIEADIDFVTKILPEIANYNDALLKLNSPKKLKIVDFEKQVSTIIEMLNPKLDLYNPDSVSEMFIKKCSLYIKMSSLKFTQERKDMVTKKEDVIVKEYTKKVNSLENEYANSDSNAHLNKIKSDVDKLLDEGKKLEDEIELEQNKKTINSEIANLEKFKSNKIKDLVLTKAQKKQLDGYSKKIDTEKNKWINIVKEGLTESIKSAKKKENTKEINEIKNTLSGIKTELRKDMKDKKGILYKKSMELTKFINALLKEITTINTTSDILDEFKYKLHKTAEGETEEARDKDLIGIHNKILNFYNRNNDVKKYIKEETAKGYIEGVRNYIETELNKKSISYGKVVAKAKH